MDWSIVEYSLSAIKSYWSQIIGIMILSIFLKIGTSGEKSRDTGKKHILCDSPNCVRCRSYAARSMDILCKEWFLYEKSITITEKNKLWRVTETMRQYELASGNRDSNQSFELLSLPSKPYYESSDFPDDVSILEHNWREIYSEYLEITTNEISEEAWKVNSTPTGKWSAYYLINQGTEVTENARRCPKTCSLLRHLQSLMRNCMFGNVCFSVVQPGTHIAEHYGPCNLRVRCHLGLDIPSGCELIVNHESRTWKTGKCTLFDDFYLHSVMHRGGENRARVIFLVDFWNPHLTGAEISGLNFILNSNKL